MAQKTKSQAAFDNMLNGMYKQTVPLIHQDSLPQGALADWLVLDTREWNEYQVSHLPGAQWVGYDNFQEYVLNNVPKDQPVLVYCSVGYRSERIGEKLQEMGFEDVRNLYGGIFDWKNHDREVVGADGQPTEKVHAYNKNWGKWLRKGERVY